MPKIAVPRTLWPAWRFLVRSKDGQEEHLWPVLAAFIDIFSGERDILWIGKALDGAASRDLFCLPEKIEIWMLPHSRTQGLCVRARIHIDSQGWAWSPVNLDSSVEGVALEWVKGQIEVLEIDRIHITEAPPSIQAACK